MVESSCNPAGQTKSSLIGVFSVLRPQVGDHHRIARPPPSTGVDVGQIQFFCDLQNFHEAWKIGVLRGFQRSLAQVPVVKNL
jgi:hypothetical protein